MYQNKNLTIRLDPSVFTIPSLGCDHVRHNTTPDSAIIISLNIKTEYPLEIRLGFSQMENVIHILDTNQICLANYPHFKRAKNKRIMRVGKRCSGALGRRLRETDISDHIGELKPLRLRFC